MYNIVEYQEREEGTGYMEIDESTCYKSFRNWGVGSLERVATPPEKVIIDVVPFDGYKGEPPELSDSTVPLMSARLRKALLEAGVDNIVYHPVTLKNTETGQTYPFYAFNLIGLISATDFDASNISSYDEDFIGDGSIKGMAIDESKLHGQNMFRLAEKFSAIFISDNVRKHIEASGIDTLKFILPEDYYAL